MCFSHEVYLHMVVDELIAQVIWHAFAQALLKQGQADPLREYPLHRLRRQDIPADTAGCGTDFLSFSRPEDPESIVNAMAEHQAMLDTIRDGLVNSAMADVPSDPEERSRHLKSFGYFSDASMVGIGPIADGMWLEAPRRNPQIDFSPK